MLHFDLIRFYYKERKKPLRFKAGIGVFVDFSAFRVSTFLELVKLSVKPWIFDDFCKVKDFKKLRFQGFISKIERNACRFTLIVFGHSD